MAQKVSTKITLQEEGGRIFIYREGYLVTTTNDGCDNLASGLERDGAFLKYPGLGGTYVNVNKDGVWGKFGGKPLTRAQARPPELFVAREPIRRAPQVSITRARTEGLDTSSSDEDATPANAAAQESIPQRGVPFVRETQSSDSEDEAQPTTEPQAPITYDQEAYKRLRAGEKNMEGANLEGADLSKPSKIDLTDIVFTHANLRNVNFKGNTLTRTKFIESNITGAHFEQTSLTRNIIRDSDLTDAQFINAQIVDSLIERTRITNSNFERATLRDCVFNLIEFPNTSPRFYLARIEGCLFHNVHFIDTDLREATICGSSTRGIPTSFDECTFRRVNFTNAHLFGVVFSKSRLQCRFGTSDTSASTDTAKSIGPGMVVGIAASWALPGVGPVILVGCSVTSTLVGILKIARRERLAREDARENSCIGLIHIISARNCILFKCKGLDEQTKVYLTGLGITITEDVAAFDRFIRELPAILAAAGGGIISGGAAGGIGAIAGAAVAGGAALAGAGIRVAMARDH